MRSYKTEGIIIKRVNLGEADRILTAFTKRHGKIRVLAKGVRRVHSRRGPNVELFNRVVLFVHKGKTFDIVTEAQVQETFVHLRNDLQRIGLAYYVCELVDSLCAEEQPHPQVFSLFTETLRNLNKRIIQAFEQQLLFELGFLPRHSAYANLRTDLFIERILERKLKSKSFLAKI